MSRTVTLFAFKDGVGSDAATYVCNGSGIIQFQEWYRDYCSQRNDVLFVIGMPGSGRSTLIRYCSNFISKKANYSLLEQNGLNEQILQFSELPRAIFNWVSSREIGKDANSLVSILCERVISQGLLRGARPHIAPKISDSFSGQEVSLEIGVDFPEEKKTLQNLVNYLRKKHNNNYIIWFSSLPQNLTNDLISIHEEIKAAGVSNLGIIISQESLPRSLDASSSVRTIELNQLTSPELCVLIDRVCRYNKIRYDIDLANYLINKGCTTFKKAISLLQCMEKMDCKYISKENAIIIVEGTDNG